MDHKENAYKNYEIDSINLLDINEPEDNSSYKDFEVQLKENTVSSKDFNFNKRIERHKKVLNKLHEIYKTKNKLYNSFSKTYQKHGNSALLIRLEDKLNRIENLLLNVPKADPGAGIQESVIDTLLDLANYSIMGIMELEKDC